MAFELESDSTRDALRDGNHMRPILPQRVPIACVQLMLDGKHRWRRERLRLRSPRQATTDSDADAFRIWKRNRRATAAGRTLIRGCVYRRTIPVAAIEN